jgi:hypothetical protein
VRSKSHPSKTLIVAEQRTSSCLQCNATLTRYQPRSSCCLFQTFLINRHRTHIPLLILLLLLTDKNKTQHNGHSTNPIQRARLLIIQHDLPNQRKRNGHAQPHRDHNRTRQQNSIRPRDITDQTRKRVRKDDGRDATRGRQCKGLDPREVQDEEPRPEEDHVQQARRGRRTWACRRATRRRCAIS